MVLEFLADGFEEIEALTPVDILRRAGVEVLTVSLRDDRIAVGSHGIAVTADISISEAAARFAGSSADMIILPGGMPGSKNLDENNLVDRFVMSAAKAGKYVAAICAAPMILGKRGLASGKHATCYPGFEEYLEGAEVGGRVVTDGNIVTACGMGAALEFALELCKLLKGEAEAEKIASSVLAK